jgi:hypothetical protein
MAKPIMATTVRSGVVAGVAASPSIGFVRVRRRGLKDGGVSTTYDVVKALRVDGRPRHKFVISLGSQKSADRRGADRVLFWMLATHRMILHRLSEPQRHRLLAELCRKGARLPGIAACKWAAAECIGPVERAGIPAPASRAHRDQRPRGQRPSSQRPSRASTIPMPASNRRPVMPRKSKLRTAR